MSGFTNYLENAVLNHIFTGTNYTPPVSLHFALFTIAPTDSGGGQEVVGSGYSRKAMVFTNSIDGSISNTDAITFTATGGNYGTIVATGLYDASSGGNLLTWEAITPATINDEDVLSFAVGSISITLD